MNRLFRYAAIIILIFHYLSAFTEDISVVFQKTFGGEMFDMGRCVRESADKGMIICGYTTSFGAGIEDVYVIKLDKAGNTQWQKTYGGRLSDKGEAVELTRDVGYIVCGTSNSFSNGSDDVYVLKLDKTGKRVWEKTFGGRGTDQGYGVQQTQDGGYILCGWSDSFGGYDMFLIKTDGQGNLEWQKTYGGIKFEEARAVRETAEGGYIVCGWTESSGAGNRDVYLVKTDKTGQVIWEKTFGGENFDEGHSLALTKEGGFIICGVTFSFGPHDAYVIKTNAAGELEWQYAFGEGTRMDSGDSVCETREGGFIICGVTNSAGAGDEDLYIVKLNSKGEKEWSRTFGGKRSDGGASVRALSDGGCIACGWTGSSGAGFFDVFAVKIH